MLDAREADAFESDKKEEHITVIIILLRSLTALSAQTLSLVAMIPLNQLPEKKRIYKEKCAPY